MIIDRETNFVYFSELLSVDLRYSHEYHRITAILDKHQIKHGLIRSTKDIWCRDYMPVQKDVNEFIQFRYEPSYLEQALELQSDPIQVHTENNIKATYSDINLDGGNVLRWLDRVIVTDRIFSENPEYTDKKKLVLELEQIFEAEVIIIPQIKSDMTGHADGLVRFYDRDTLIGNRMKGEYLYWQKGMKRVLADYSLKYIDLPFFKQYQEMGFPWTAIGYYINYLEIGNLIMVPIFETKKNKDDEAFRILTEIFSDRTIETVKINNIAKEGGLLNCISWNIKGPETDLRKS